MSNLQETKKKLSSHDELLKGKLIDVINDPKNSYNTVLEYIQNEITESTRVITFNYRVKCFLEDGAYALSRAVESIHGFTTQKNTGPSDDAPPEMIDVRFADGTRKKVPYGTINLPSLGKKAFIRMNYDPANNEFLLEGQCEKRYVRLMDEMIEETTKIVREDSIYKGRAVKITREGVSPEFIDLSNVDKTPLFLTPEAVFATRPIEARIEHTERCIKNKIDLKFGVLLEGNYGLVD
jgi:hypothetical protein